MIMFPRTWANPYLVLPKKLLPTHKEDRGREVSTSKSAICFFCILGREKHGAIEKRFNLENKRAKYFIEAGNPVNNSLMLCGALVPGEFPSYNLFGLKFFGLQLLFNNLCLTRNNDKNNENQVTTAGTKIS